MIMFRTLIETVKNIVFTASEAQYIVFLTILFYLIISR